MFLSNLSIKQPVFATMMMVALAVLGLNSYRTLSVDLFPEIDFPIVTITTPYPGASPETIERDVTRKIEEAVNTVEGVRHIESTSQEGISSVVIQFFIEVPTLAASQDVRAKIAAVRGDLPREIDEPIIQRIDPADQPVVSVAVDAPALSPRAISDIADRTVKRRLENVPGVGSVNLVGEANREIQVVVDRARLDAYGLSLAQVIEALRTENVDAPAGSADRGDTEATVRVAARGRTGPQIAALPVKRVGDTTLFVGDVAQVIDGIEQPTSAAWVNDRPAIALDVQKQSGANTVEVADGVRAAVAAMAGELPPGVALQIVRDDSTFIRDSIEDVQVTLVLGGLLTILIVFVFLNSWRSTVITGLTLPISVIAAFIVMRFFGFTLNVLTLMGLSLAIGMLIDDAIVVRENIVRHMQRGKGHLEAARDGTAEIGLAVMATTFTIVAVFIPVAFMSGLVGQFFYEFGITVTAAVLVSLFVSFTLDPMLSSRWYDPDVEEHRRRGFVGRGLQYFNRRFDDLHGSYERVLAWSLRHRWVVVVTAVAAFVGAFPILALLGGDFMPDFNRGEYQVTFKATPGATLRETGDRAVEMTARLRALPDVEYTYTTIGQAGSVFRPVTQGATYVKLREGRGKTFSEVLRDGREAVRDVPGLTTSFNEASSFGDKPIQLSVRGVELDVLDRFSLALVSSMERIAGVADIERSLEKSKPELRVEVDRARASDLGIPVAAIATTLQAGVDGAVATTIEDDLGDTHDVRVRLRADQRRFGADLMRLTVPTDKDDANGDKILKELREVASVVPGSAPSTIRRKDLVREVRVSANPDGRPLQNVLDDIYAAAAALNLPPGYDIVAGGDAEELEVMFTSMFEALTLAVIFIYLILASQFGSFTHPLAIMLSLPLSLVGVAGALLITGDTLNIMSMIGLIMLMGLVTKNAILLVDFTNQSRAAGMGRTEALIRAGSTRLRPIVMTTLAMIFGMLPLAFAIGAGAEMRAPMARAVIGGLITSTLLSLLVVPVVYTFLDDFRPAAVLGWLRGRRKVETPRPAPAPVGGRVPESAQVRRKSACGRRDAERSRPESPVLRT
jgi:HAE1 family hydrophobic/amphiphilic exporter-1